MSVDRKACETDSATILVYTVHLCESSSDWRQLELAMHQRGHPLFSRPFSKSR
jgi:hypothetical protein